MKKIDLRGNWGFCLDKDKIGVDKNYYNIIFQDNINLPTTVSAAKKGTFSEEVNTDYLTDPYLFEGFTWYSKNVEVADTEGKEFFLVLERTRVSHVWVDGQYAGSNNSLCSSHRYRLTPFVSKALHKLTIMVDNTSYPVKGGHMTSPDTQTNWNGITGEIYIEICNKVYLDGVKIYPDAAKKLINVKVTLHGAPQYTITASVSDGEKDFQETEYQLFEGENHFTYLLDGTAVPWSEHSPKLYTLHMDACGYSFGLRDFKAAGKYFEINGVRTFLRGKHDGLIFPITGYAPTDVESWLKVLGTAKQYGINHYRFHTCCPPEAAFAAADLLGIYMEPELPFWGTVTGEGEENHDEKGQQYLIDEGSRILNEYGNHPSFVMMSLGNELWGSKKRLNEILGWYRQYDTRHLYTQGSNNFQFMPCILENEDFFCGVRFSRDRLFRGSYAMCDAPQGHIQTMPPDTIYNYDQMIRPTDMKGIATADGEITIQYGTGIKTVKMDASEEMIPQVPVVSHEIGQYAMYPDFSEISRYTGVLKPGNLEVFRKRLEEKGMLPMAEMFFKASGKFAVECYKAEIETAMRSSELAGFQVLDLQDFTGQGTALIGILNSFMESKGLISASEWRQFCSDTVLLAELPRLVFSAGESVHIGVRLACFTQTAIVNPKLELTVLDGREVILWENKILQGDYSNGVYKLCDFIVKLPDLRNPKKLGIYIRIAGTEIRNSYDIWLYPVCKSAETEQDIAITGSISEACTSLLQGRSVLFYPENLNDGNSIEGTYCTDFWCYPMFRSISESAGKPVPIGTHGLRIDENHEIFKDFPTECYTTPQWYDFITNSRAIILDDTDIEPVVWSIDNFERNHRLGNIFELKAGKGKLLVCTSDLRKIQYSYPARWLEYSLLKYISSDNFKPESEIGIDELKYIFGRQTAEL